MLLIESTYLFIAHSESVRCSVLMPLNLWCIFQLGVASDRLLCESSAQQRTLTRSETAGSSVFHGHLPPPPSPSQTASSRDGAGEQRTQQDRNVNVNLADNAQHIGFDLKKSNCVSQHFTSVSPQEVNGGSQTVRQQVIFSCLLSTRRAFSCRV